VRRGLRDDEEFRALVIAAVVVLASGTSFYSTVEGWSLLDALYFCTIVLTTVGLGDLTPETAAGKIFTIGYVLVGIGILLAFVDRVAEQRGRARARRT
jgi:voltage-gated potassium channel